MPWLFACYSPNECNKIPAMVLVGSGNIQEANVATSQTWAPFLSVTPTFTASITLITLIQTLNSFQWRPIKLRDSSPSSCNTAWHHHPELFLLMEQSFQVVAALFKFQEGCCKSSRLGPVVKDWYWNRGLLIFFCGGISSCLLLFGLFCFVLK